MEPISQAERATAKGKLIKMLVGVSIVGILMVASAVFYLANAGIITTSMLVAVIGGVFVSVVLGAGLMALGFYSERSGRDDDVSASTGPPSTD
ncbi:hypothetical protein [Glacieibacterium sp.]|uniref:hypothetical protein n=1 Tax=Glacieibacterium sp. TaxID=2860237 RepID=UPI003B00B236